MDSSNLNFIVAAYAVTWIVLLGYLARLIRKGGRAHADFDRMAQGRRVEQN